ncbi:MAG: hypothetical protein ACO1O6_12190 [Bacteroidota bacterium]
MRIKILIFALLSIIGCSKIEKSKLEQPEFKELVGTWTTDYPNDEERRVIVHKTGKVEIFKSTERGEKFRITEFKISESGFTYDGEFLDHLTLISRVNAKVEGSIHFFKNLNSDVAYIGFGYYINNFEMDTNFSVTNKIFYKQ